MGAVWNERGRCKSWLKRRAKETGRWAEIVREREKAAAELKAAHPDWSLARCKVAAWDVVLKNHSQLLEGTPAMGTETAEPYRVLLAAVPSDRRSRETDDIRWVYQHLDDEWATINPDDVPSRGALVMLKVAKDDRHFFLRELLVKLIPTRAQVDNARHEDLSRASPADLIEMLLGESQRSASDSNGSP